MMETFFSISMPIYNADKYLDRCIESIIMQTEEAYEIILVDDGSTDQSIEICRKWEKKYPDKIRIFESKNKGSLVARRIAIENSNGKFLYIMDADDYLIDKEALNKIRRVIEKYSCDLVFFNVTRDEECKSKYYYYPFHDKEVFTEEKLVKIYEQILSSANFNTLWNKVFSRKLIDNGTAYKECPITNGTDFYQMLPIVSSAKKIVYIDEVFYFYRMTEGSIVNKFKSTRFISTKINLHREIEYAKQWKYKPSNWENKIEIGILKTLAGVIYKVRLLPFVEVKTACSYLKSVREDDFFIQHYKKEMLKKIALERRFVLMMLYKKMYLPLYFFVRMSELLNK